MKALRQSELLEARLTSVFSQVLALPDVAASFETRRELLAAQNLALNGLAFLRGFLTMRAKLPPVSAPVRAGRKVRRAGSAARLTTPPNQRAAKHFPNGAPVDRGGIPSGARRPSGKAKRGIKGGQAQ